MFFCAEERKDNEDESFIRWYMCEACQFEAVNITVTWALQFACKTNFQVTHSRIGRRISHGYDPASFVATRIGPLLSVLYP